MLRLPQRCCSKPCCSSLEHLLRGQWRRSEGRSPYGAAASRWPSVCPRRRAQTCSCSQPEHTVSTDKLKGSRSLTSNMKLKHLKISNAAKCIYHRHRFINTFSIYSTITHRLNWILLTQIFNSTMYADYMQNDSIKNNIMQISVSYPFQWTIWHQSSPIKDVLVIISDFSELESTGRHREEAISECLKALKTDWHSIYKAPALVSTWLLLFREVFHLWLPSLFCFVRFQYQNNWESKQGITAYVLLLALTVPSECVFVAISLNFCLSMRKIVWYYI